LPTSTVTSSCGRPSSAVRDQRRSACAACAHRCRDGAESADLRQIIAFRNVLIHGYAAVDPARLWRVIEENLPPLSAALAALLAASE